MSKKVGLICVLCSFILGISMGSFWTHTIYPKNIVVKDSIIYRDSLVRDSLYIINDSIKTQIKYIEKKHYQDSTIIMSNDDSTNLEFFSKYIKYYNNK